MALSAGTRLGPYEIIVAIGAGGMGVVYRATDTTLKRDVAIKVLPDALAHVPERLARFEREAQVLASLNHPHIAQIYGPERSSGTQALVMELVEGEDLAVRIARGAMPLDEALPVATQIAEALDAAHEHGIIHRDLKPANIKVRPDDTVKVLDFGLAKLAVGGGQPVGGGGQLAAGSVPLSMSPTITSPAMMTGVGVILGTAAYMSPEQAKGREADKRSDIWAFGCVLFEMLTGKRAFDGEDVTETLAAILMREPDWTALPPTVPPFVRTLLQGCLAKDRRRRVADISTALFVLDKGAMPGPQDPAYISQDPAYILKDAAAAQTTAAVSDVRRVLARSTRRRVAITVAAAILIGAVVAGGAVWVAMRPASVTPATIRFQIPAPGASPAQMFTLSADGRYLAFIANTGGPNQVWVRAMDALESRALAGTDGATYPFWSPDGAYLGFFAQGKLKKIATGGGPAQTLCDVIDGRGGSWNRDGVILFSAGPASPILRVAAAGGVPAPVTRLPEGDAVAGHRFPAFLPDGIHFLFNAIVNRPDAGGLYAGSLDRVAPLRVLPDQTNALYVPPDVPSGNGYLVFRRENTLMAQPFDPMALTLSGEMFPIAVEVPNSVNNGFGAFSVAEAGTLVYRTGGPAANRELVWADRSGRRLRVATKQGAFNGSPTISPNDRTAAARINTGDQADIWLQDMNRDVISRFTFGPGNEGAPVWSPDGSRLTYYSLAVGGATTDLHQKPASGNGREELLLHGGVNAFPSDWSSDGKWIVYRQTSQTTATDLWPLPLDGDRKPIPYLQTPFNETNARFAPGLGGVARWMAYQSNESGQDQIYVQAIPASGAKYQISTSGGTQPTWRRDGKELFYLSTDQKLMAVSIMLGASVEVGTPQELFANSGVTGYAPSADGQRFLVNVPAGGDAAAAPPITVVLNWAAGLPK